MVRASQARPIGRRTEPMRLPAVLRVDPTLARRLAAMVLAGLSLAAATGCTKKVIAAAPAPVPLAVPVVPPRLVGPVQVPDERPQPVAEVPAAPAQRPTSRPPRLANRPPETTPEGPDEAQRARAEGAEAAPAVATAPPLLRTRETANDAEAVKKVRDLLDRAEQNLAKVNYRTLSTIGKEDADTARRFILQGRRALDKRQLTFAMSLADKADALSTSLAKR
jgi:hypothetical protein